MVKFTRGLFIDALHQLWVMKYNKLHHFAAYSTVISTATICSDLHLLIYSYNILTAEMQTLLHRAGIQIYLQVLWRVEQKIFGDCVKVDIFQNIVLWYTYGEFLWWIYNDTKFSVNFRCERIMKVFPAYGRVIWNSTVTPFVTTKPVVHFLCHYGWQSKVQLIIVFKACCAVLCCGYCIVIASFTFVVYWKY